MGKKKLSEDEIKWILSLDATDAQQELRKVDKDSKQLTATNKGLKAKMTELVAAGKKESKEYKNLSAEVQKNNNKLESNKKRVKELEKTMGVTSLTMDQLRKRAKDLQYQLDQTSQATSPEAYNRLDKSLRDVRSRMAELRTSGEQTGDSLSGGFLKVSTIVKGFMALKVVQFLKDITISTFNVRKEFAKYEAVLRNTFQSTEKATEAMTMLKQLAQDTPYSLQEITEAYIKMVNRGIIPTRQELVKLGDLASSQGKSLDQLIEALLDAQAGEFERLKEFGIKANKENDKVKFGFKGITTEVGFTEKAISDYLYSLGEMKGVQGGMAVQMEELEGRVSNLGDSWDGLLNKIGTRLEPVFKSALSIISSWVKDLSTMFTSSNEGFQEQFDKVVSLETELPSLISQYEELKSKISLNKDEQVLLKKTISSIAQIAPGAITAFDEYGNALDINTEKVYQYVEAERLRLQYLNESNIKSIEFQIKRLTNEKNRLESELKIGGRLMPGSNLINPYTASEKGEKEQEILKLGILMKDANEKLKHLNGQSLQEQVDSQKEKLAKQAEFNQMTKQQLEEYININKESADKYVEIAKEIYDNKFKEDKKPVTPKETKSALELKLKEQENAHAAELSALKNTQLQEEQSESFYNLQRLSADAKFYEDRLNLLKEYQKKTSDPKLQADINKNINDAHASLLVNQEKRDGEMLKVIKDSRDKRLKVEEQSFKTQQITFAKNLAERQITQQQYDMLMLSAEAATSDNRLKINQDYQSDVVSLELTSGDVKAKAVEEANQAVLDADLQAAQSRAAQQKALQNLVKDFKSEFKLTTVEEDTEAQMKVLEASYQARKEMAEKEHLDTAELDDAYEKAKTNLLQQEEEKRNQIRQQYGLLSMQEQYDIEQAQLKQQYEKGLIDEEEYQKAKNLIKVNYLKKAFDYYSGMFSGAISALQDAELANIDAKYDAEIQRAGDNTEEVERLEKEKENKKLAIQKKYAGVQFAIKVSEIIANTAVAIMMAHAQLGPVAGAIAAAMLSVTGAAQIAVANAEREKIMNMTADTASGTTTGSSGTRVASGRETGGYISVIRAQDGKEFDAVLEPGKRGFVDKPTVIVGEGPEGKSREWVASNDALQNPTVVPFINVLNESQEKGEIRTVDMNQLMRKRLAGFEKGGPISSNTQIVDTMPIPENNTDNVLIPNSSMQQLVSILMKLYKEGVKAYVIQSELQKEQKRMEDSRKIGSK